MRNNIGANNGRLTRKGSSIHISVSSTINLQKFVGDWLLVS